ncbi:MAG: tRNA (cytidine(34)-2'-O)-methyltransferase [Betaproteobacteria bacterium]|nr:tRNA (cytidine(34)-2'-O)-methyltransferase [Betaproteobacteria bacterium]MBI2959826.1 tRNA (cytidine(34)-2'-O)-methyltransferase [Betaproteobacteria bacterium]
MFDVVLYQPEIPPNTGNVIRLCANTGCRLHLVKPLGFRLSDRALRRAGLDYAMVSGVREHADWNACLDHFAARRLYAYTTRASRLYCEPAYRPGDVLVFGPETRGLPPEVLQPLAEDRRLRLPMLPASRSANLANTVAVVVYEAWRQQGFAGGS